jgi:membrane dipeptidase
MLGLLTLNFPRLWAWQTDPSRFQQADFQRLKDSGITIFHPAVGYTTGDICTDSLRDITQWNTFIAAHPRQFLRVDGPADLELAKAQGKIGIVIGQQNSGHFRCVEDVDRFYGLGQRVSQLTYCRNQIGGGSSDPRDDGLSAYGALVVQRMNEVGMAVDISHCADRTTLDAIEASQKPVLVTHSNCRALVPNSRRCKTDEAIRRVAARGGVMGITMVRFFVRAAGEVTIEDVLDHIDHVAKLVGVEHVGVGSDVDLDGRDIRIRPKRKCDLDGIDYARKVYDLTEGLLRRHYSCRNIELILGGNFERALSGIWAV